MGECWISDCGKVGVYKGLLGILWEAYHLTSEGSNYIKVLKGFFSVLFSFQSEFKSFRTKINLVI